MTESTENELLRQEVTELTELMRDDSDFSDVREILTSKGLSPVDTWLAGYISGEEGGIYGVFIVDDAGRCVLFETDTYGELIRWDTAPDIAALERDFRAVATGVEMKLAGEVL